LATLASERKSFFKRIRGKDKEEVAEMTFFDHIEELRWHLVRSILAWLIAAIAIFVYIDWVYDNIILAPAMRSLLHTAPFAVSVSGFIWVIVFVCPGENRFPG
jgi:Sec-independent protein secretion pathway component TatC